MVYFFSTIAKKTPPDPKDVLLSDSYTVFRDRPVTFFLVNRVEHQKLVEFSVFNSAFGRHRSLSNTYDIIINRLLSSVTEKKLSMSS